MTTKKKDQNQKKKKQMKITQKTHKIQNIGRLGKDGMKETNEEIIKMMISD